MTEQSTISPVPTTLVLGVPVSRLGMEATLAEVARLLEVPGHHLIVTADASGLAIAQEDPELMAVYRAAVLATPDSQGVVWALRLKGHGGLERVSGVDLVDRICALSAERGTRLFFLGAAPGVADEAAERMRLRHPGVNIVGTRHGFFPASDDELVAQEIAAARPDVVFAAMGIPRQEKFLAHCLPLTGARVGMGVGGSLDVFSGRARRAPRWVQGLKLEWLWRTVLNPKKFSKAKMLPRFAWLVMRERK